MSVDFEPLAPAPGAGPIGRREVRLWRLALDPPAAVVAAGRRLLTDDERTRADRFHFDRHRRRYTVGRAALRVVLGALVERPPAALRFAYGARGKPALDELEGAPQFNLTNSHELALIAVTAEQPVGVDLEHLRAMPDALLIAESHFSAAERRVLAAYAAGPEDRRDAAFFRCWTRKEAYIKAIGGGLSMPLDRFDVAFDDHAPCRFLALDGDPQEAAAWTLAHLDPQPGYLGALAVRGRGFTLSARTLDPAALAAAAP